jgi:hypothetical protein
METKTQSGGHTMKVSEGIIQDRNGKNFSYSFTTFKGRVILLGYFAHTNYSELVTVTFPEAL